MYVNYGSPEEKDTEDHTIFNDMHEGQQKL